MFKSDLVKKINQAINDNFKYVGISVKLPEGHTEYIINHCLAFEDKLEYYNNTYDIDLIHKHNPNIRIINVAIGNSFDEIEEILI